MDLSVTRSPRNGSQNGETGVPMSLSVRDATKINSLDSAEITKIHQVPSSFSISKAVELAKSSSPTPSSMSQSSNSPKSPKPASKRPVKKVDSILERLNSGSDGVVIVPVQHTPSPHSVIVSAHSLEDSNSRGSSSSCNITPVISGSNYGSCEITNVDKGVSIIKTSHPLPNSENSQTPIAYTDSNYSNKEPRLLESLSVIKESIGTNKDETNLTNYLNEDSNGSSSDSSRSRRRRKQLKTTRVETDETPVNCVNENVALPNALHNIINEKLDENKIVENRMAADLSRLPLADSIGSSTIIQKVSDQNKSIDDRLSQNVEQLNCENSTVQTVSKTRRKSCSESETIDNIAAMIASTNSTDSNIKDMSISDNISDNFKPSASNLINNLDQVLGSPTAETKIIQDHQILLENNKIDSELSVDTKVPNIDMDKTNIVKKTDDNTVPQDKNKSMLKTSYVEVENELEKMFAGIEEDNLTMLEDKSQIPVLDPVLEINSNSSLTVNTKSSKKKQNLRKSSDGLSPGLISSDECSPKKKQKPGKRKAAADSNRSNKKKTKLNLFNKKSDKKIDPLPSKDAYDSGSNASSSKSRGPYVQIKGPRDSPLSVSVINTPIQEDDVDKPLQKIRNPKPKPSLNTDINFRNKVKSKGLHTSTLSMKYDATTTDTSWICVFCKRGPHTRDGSSNTVIHGKSQHMGDLFGPYLVTTDCPDYASMMSDPHDTLFKGKINRHESFYQNKQSQRAKKIKLDPENSSDVVKSSFPNEEMYLGMTEAGTNCFEIWLHEDCAVWAPGLYLVGPKVVGLEAAVWSCCTMRCSLCSVLGATVACIKRGCQKTMHVNCARADLWSLSEDDYMVYCNEHRMP